MKLEEVHKDWRGATNILKSDGKELATIFTNCDGALRGGHSHSYNTHLFVVKGTIDFIWTETPDRPENSKYKRYDAVKNPVVQIPKGTPLITVSVGNSIVIETRDSPERKVENYPPYRRLIETENPMNAEQVMEMLKG